MSDLPDDLSQWPSDSFRLLGVEQTVSERELKRAYVRLIKKFKPEQYPRHFRRLRDAFEEIQRNIDYLGIVRGSIAEERRDATPAAADENEAGEGRTPPLHEHKTRSDDRPSPKAHIDGRDGSDASWDWACCGQLSAAYERMQAELLPVCADERIFLRLYWLLTTAPDLDPNRQPLDWIYEGLKQSGFNGRLALLYRREVNLHPEEAADSRLNKLLEQFAAVPEIIELLQSRWLAFDQLRSRSIWDVPQFLARIVDDVAIAEQRLQHEDESLSAVVLFTAVDFLIWEDHPAVSDFITNAVSRLNAAHHIHTRLGWRFDRYDALSTVAYSWHQLCARRKLPWTTELAKSMLEFVRYATVARHVDGSAILRRCQTEITADPQSAITILDKASSYSAALGGVLVRELQLASDEIDSTDDDFAPPGLLEYTRSFILESPWYNYARFRRLLLDFCLEEAIAPQTAAEAIADCECLTISDGRHLREEIDSDAALHLIYSATCSALQPQLALVNLG